MIIKCKMKMKCTFQYPEKNYKGLQGLLKNYKKPVNNLTGEAQELLGADFNENVIFEIVGE